jgi:hypothetical protein
MARTDLRWYSAQDITFDRRSLAGAAGGFCEVLVGRHLQQGKVAMKRLGVRLYISKRPGYALIIIQTGADQDWGGVQDEMKLWERLDHDNVLPFLGIFIEGPYMYLISPWVEKGALPSYLSHNSKVDRIRLVSHFTIHKNLRRAHVPCF